MRHHGHGAAASVGSTSARFFKESGWGCFHANSSINRRFIEESGSGRAESSCCRHPAPQPASMNNQLPFSARAKLFDLQSFTREGPAAAARSRIWGRRVSPGLPRPRLVFWTALLLVIKAPSCCVERGGRAKKREREGGWRPILLLFYNAHFLRGSLSACSTVARARARVSRLEQAAEVEVEV